MKKLYTKPELKINKFETEDVIATSCASAVYLAFNGYKYSNSNGSLNKLDRYSIENAETTQIYHVLADGTTELCENYSYSYDRIGVTQDNYYNNEGNNVTVSDVLSGHTNLKQN